jgi:hypothetical protein
VDRSGGNEQDVAGLYDHRLAVDLIFQRLSSFWSFDSQWSVDYGQARRSPRLLLFNAVF